MKLIFLYGHAKFGDDSGVSLSNQKPPLVGNISGKTKVSKCFSWWVEFPKNVAAPLTRKI